MFNKKRRKNALFVVVKATRSCRFLFWSLFLSFTLMRTMMKKRDSDKQPPGIEGLV